ncbi:SET and MYND domain-containing protein 3 [Anas platyrhynchos]|uniref:SET and MYND domain-containing protein 3 n=1 Tax=Anas platyrhynchos TaxID=8839 RepID=R0LDS9_ANAPL|nr:SET and MYND domain-containing protein 3 [Anas platyrhynchos]
MHLCEGETGQLKDRQDLVGRWRCLCRCPEPAGDTEQLSEEMKDGLRHLAHTLQLYLKAEIQDASHLPAAIDFFQIFTKERHLKLDSVLALQEQCDGCSLYWHTGEKYVQAFKNVDVHACGSICMCGHLLFPPMYSTKLKQEGIKYRVRSGTQLMLLCRDPLVWLCCESEAKELAVSGAVDCVLSWGAVNCHAPLQQKEERLFQTNNIFSIHRNLSLQRNLTELPLSQQVHFLIQHVLSVDMGGESTDVPHARSGGGAAVLLEGCLAGGHDSQPQQSSRDHALPHAPLSQGPVSSFSQLNLVQLLAVFRHEGRSSGEGVLALNQTEDKVSQELSQLKTNPEKEILISMHGKAGHSI